ncbi:MAG: RluA family pseudouridine synthase [Planctomycetota bacterium]
MVPIPILHTDEHLLVVDKPAGVLVTAAPGRNERSLIDHLGDQLGHRVYAVHRLDEGTTGVLVVAVTEAGRLAMDPLFRAHAVRREYLALVVGRPQPDAGRIESQLREVGDVVRVVERGGQRAVTDYRTLDRRGRLSLLACQLETGRRNQIRVHMQALDCPIAGDRKYGYRAREGERFRRPMLHSWRVEFVHPLLGIRVSAEALPPEPELRP